MSDDQDIPVVHTWLFVTVLGACVVAMLFLLTACGSAPVLTEVKVPVLVECKEEVPERPAIPTEGSACKPTIDHFAVAAWAEIEIREGYETRLRTALEACTAPMKPENQ